jgi:transposase
MASIIKKIKKGHAYYYAVQSQRIDGKPRIVWQKYLGTIDAIIGRADDATPPEPKEVVIFQAGGVAALARIAQRLGLVELIDAVVPKMRNQGPTVGQYLLLAAINRALEPCSKQAMGQWYEQTVLRRLWGFEAEAFSSQRFWDHMDRVQCEHIETIQDHLLVAIEKTFGLDAGLLLYDTTNFYTHIDTTNTRCQLAQRGRNKQKRDDLRQYGLALLLTRDFQIPILHHVYEGHISDVSLFPKLTQDLLVRYHRATGRSSGATLVFDKGNISDDAMAPLAISLTNFVAAVPANCRPDLLGAPLAQFHPLPTLPGTQVFATTEEFWGKTCRAVVTYTESFFSQQLHGVTQSMVRCQNKLLDLAKGLQRWQQGKGRGQRPTAAGVRKSVQRILTGQFMTELFQTEVTEDKKTRLPQLRYCVDHVALDRLSQQRLGRTLIVSSHTSWSDQEIVETYRGLSGIEDAFRNMKNVDYLRWQPAYHWTDQKLRVHGLYSVLALLLACLARKVAIQGGIELPLISLLDELTAIHEVAIVYPPHSLGQRKDHLCLSRMSSHQKKLAEAFQIAEMLAGQG